MGTAGAMHREGGRRGGRASRREARTAFDVTTLPVLDRSVPVYEVLDPDQLEAVHQASLRILEEIGIEFRDDEAAAMWRAAGADVRGHRVHLSPALVMELVAKAPGRINVLARNPERRTEIGGKKVAFAPTYGSPFVYDFNNERRYGTLDDLQNFHKLAYLSPVIHNTGAVICEPVDIPVSKRHLHITYSAIKHSDKPFMGPVTAPERAADAVKMAKLVFGAEVVDANPVMLSIMNCNSPLVWDETMLGAMKVYARANQVSIVSPFVMAGANAPASAAAAVAQLNAEALAGIAFTQVCRAGSPVIYGHFLATISMKSGAPMAGTPEMGLMNLMIGQLARKYDVPLRSSGMMASSKRVDAQAAYESIQTMYPVFLAGTNYVMHSCGWDEAGLAASFAKFVLDAEQIEMFYRFGQGPQFGDFDEAIAAIHEVGPGGHYLGTEHTQSHFQTAFYLPELADNNSYEQWFAEGSKDSTERAIEKAKMLLANYEAPPLDPAVDEALLAFIAEREAVLPNAVE
ncbi:MAG: trimethylamine methyltransferase family protein [Geminicoccaceae bacterium]